MIGRDGSRIIKPYHYYRPGHLIHVDGGMSPPFYAGSENQVALGSILALET